MSSGTEYLRLFLLSKFYIYMLSYSFCTNFDFKLCRLSSFRLRFSFKTLGTLLAFYDMKFRLSKLRFSGYLVLLFFIIYNFLLRNSFYIMLRILVFLSLKGFILSVSFSCFFSIDCNLGRRNLD